MEWRRPSEGGKRSGSPSELTETWWRLRVWMVPWLEDAFVLFLTDQGISGVEIIENEDLSCVQAYLFGECRMSAFERKIAAYSRALEEVHGCSVVRGWETDAIRDADWRDAWKVHFHSARVSPRFMVKPSWEGHSHPEGIWVLEIDPGQAFGTGLHETTRMCLEWIDRSAGTCLKREPSRALDVGAGTGILSIALARVGFEEVVAVDVDPVAVEAAAKNARINRVGEQVRVIEGTIEDLSQERFSFVTANLTGRGCMDLSMEFARCLEPAGRLLASGVLVEERASVLGVLQDASFILLGESRREEWCALMFRRA